MAKDTTAPIEPTPGVLTYSLTKPEAALISLIRKASRGSIQNIDFVGGEPRDIRIGVQTIDFSDEATCDRIINAVEPRLFAVDLSPSK